MVSSKGFETECCGFKVIISVLMSNSGRSFIGKMTKETRFTELSTSNYFLEAQRRQQFSEELSTTCEEQFVLQQFSRVA